MFWTSDQWTWLNNECVCVCVHLHIYTQTGALAFTHLRIYTESNIRRKSCRLALVLVVAHLARHWFGVCIPRVRATWPAARIVTFCSRYFKNLVGLRTLFNHMISNLIWFVHFVSPPKCYHFDRVNIVSSKAWFRCSHWTHFPSSDLTPMPKCSSMASLTLRLSVGLLASDCYEKTTGQTCQMQCIRGYDLIGAARGLGSLIHPHPLPLKSKNESVWLEGHQEWWYSFLMQCLFGNFFPADARGRLHEFTAYHCRNTLVCRR